MIQEYFSKSSNFYKLKRENLISGRGGRGGGVGPILQKVSVIWSLLLYFNFKNFMDPNSMSFIRCQHILDDARVLFSEP